MTTFTPQNSYTKEELLACGRGELFGAGNAQLPLPNMLMIDRIVEINNTGGKYGKGEIIAELDINPDLWFFGCHFVGDPVMPGCLPAPKISNRPQQRIDDTALIKAA